MATIWQQPKCCRCRRRFDVKTDNLVPLPDTWQCGRDDCERAPSTFSTTSRVTVREGALKGSKYHNEPTEVDGIKFASKKEANRYAELKLMERAGEIGELRTHVRFRIAIGSEEVCSYICDFQYYSPKHGLIVEDAKGVRTPVFKLKKKLMKACLGIEVVEV